MQALTTLERAHQIRILPNRAIQHHSLLLYHTQPQRQRALACPRLLLARARALSEAKRPFDRVLRALGGALHVDKLGGARAECVLRERAFVACAAQGEGEFGELKLGGARGRVRVRAQDGELGVHGGVLAFEGLGALDG